MRRFLRIAAKSVLILILLMFAGLWALNAYIEWHSTHNWGLPTEGQIATVSSTGPTCAADHYQPMQRPYVPLAKIPPLTRKAAILAVDLDFYERLRPDGFFMGLIHALTHSRTQAEHRLAEPSTITERVADCLMSFLEPTHHIGHFAPFLARRVDRALSRDRILEIFLNETYVRSAYGYGIGNASMVYFSKPLDQLSIDETALLAAALKERSSMFERDTDYAREQRNAVINRMLQAGVVSEADAATARERPINRRQLPAAKPQ